MDDFYDLEFDQNEKAIMFHLKCDSDRSYEKTYAELKRLFPKNYPSFETMMEWSVSKHWEASCKNWDRMNEQMKYKPEKQEAAVYHPNVTLLDVVNGENPTKESQLIKCRKAMNQALKGHDSRMYYNLLKLECELGGLLIRKESIIVNNIDSMTKDELADARSEIERKLKQLDDIGRRTIDQDATDITDTGDGETEAS